MLGVESGRPRFGGMMGSDGGKERVREKERIGRPREGLLRVYSAIWCLCCKANKLKKRKNRRRDAGPVSISWRKGGNLRGRRTRGARVG